VAIHFRSIKQIDINMNIHAFILKFSKEHQ
jgi:hypothetical protein